MPTLTLVAALGRDRVIGRTDAHGIGTLPWHLPEDLAHFRQITQGKPVVMGRRTWESLPERFRPLPGRHNIVVSRNPAYAAPGATVVPTLEAARDAAGTVTEICVIGGAMLYTQAIEVADVLELTEIDLAVPDGDAHFPIIDPAHWVERSRTPGVSRNGLAYAFRTMDRRR